MNRTSLSSSGALLRSLLLACALVTVALVVSAQADDGEPTPQTSWVGINAPGFMTDGPLPGPRRAGVRGAAMTHPRLAQTGAASSADPGGAGGNRAELRERVQERIRMMRAWRLTEALTLSDATAARLFAYLDECDARMRPERERLETLARTLRSTLQADEGSDDEIEAQLEEIMATHLRVEAMRVELVRGTEGFLDARQRAGLMLFIPEFERQVRELVQEVRQSGMPGRQGRPDVGHGPMGPPGGVSGPGRPHGLGRPPSPPPSGD